MGNYVNNWNINTPLWLKTDKASYPQWESNEAVILPSDTSEVFEYKYIIKQVGIFQNLI